LTRLARPPASCRVMTPDELANAVVGAIGAPSEARWLEPSHGDGAFLRAIRATGVSRTQVWARDLDPRSAIDDQLAQSQRGVDFLDPKVFPRARFDAIVGNPPYLAIERLRGKLRRTAAETIDLKGDPIGENGNLWYAFVCKAIRLLNNGGSIGLVLPASSEFADYARSGREAIRRHFRSVEITRFRNPPFQGVVDGSVVLIARGYNTKPRKSSCPWSRHLCDSLREFRRKPAVRAENCPAQAKSKAGRVSIGKIATIRIGAVTGDASYFLLSESQRKSRRIPRSVCVSVLSRSRHLREPVVGQRVFDELVQADERVWLFRPRPVDLKRSAVAEYLGSGLCNLKAAKIRSRERWYETPLPGPADAFISGMGPGNLALTLSRKNDLYATNTLFQITMIDRKHKICALPLAIAMLSESSRRQCERLRRHYAGGLRKLEPSDIARVQVPWPIQRPSIRGYREAIQLLQLGKKKAANDVIRSMI